MLDILRQLRVWQRFILLFQAKVCSGLRDIKWVRLKSRHAKVTHAYLLPIHSIWGLFRLWGLNDLRLLLLNHTPVVTHLCIGVVPGVWLLSHLIVLARLFFVLLVKDQVDLWNRSSSNLFDFHLCHGFLYIFKVIFGILVFDIQVTARLVPKRLHAFILGDTDWDLAMASWNIFLWEFAHFEHRLWSTLFWVFRSGTRFWIFLKVTDRRSPIWWNTTAADLWG